MPDIPVKTTYDIETGETTVELLTAGEIAALELAETAEAEAKAARDAAIASAIAKLQAIGLTSEEIAALIGVEVDNG